ncbi:MAG: TraR/DksA C4-type zinc finger protein [Thermoleophilaceae bacterium]|nr:TraR/DksA C4-type zinc finger protein [Thermoleophilaceae bacterium]
MQTVLSPPSTEATREMPPISLPDSSPLSSAPLIFGAPGVSCPSCNSMVAPDQRYCVDCGERIGDPRLPVMDGRSAVQPVQQPALTYPPLAYGPPLAPPKSKWASGIVLLSTIGVLLLAMGVGVMIGDRGDARSAVAQQPVIIGAAGATAPTAGATAATAGTDKSASASTDADAETKSGVDANALAKKNGVKLAPSDVDLGEACPKGSVGCDAQGKFTGDYFK